MSLNLKYKSTHKASPPTSPTKVKGKVQRLCGVYAILHNVHIQNKNSHCGIRSCPPNRNDDCLPCFLYQSFFYGERSRTRRFPRNQRDVRSTPARGNICM